MAGEDRKGEIYAELSRLRDLSGKLREVAQSLKKLADDDYAGGLAAVKESWSGESADLFAGKAQAVQTDVSDICRRIGEAADTLDKVAKNYADTELRAIEMAGG